MGVMRWFSIDTASMEKRSDEATKRVIQDEAGISHALFSTSRALSPQLRHQVPRPPVKLEVDAMIPIVEIEGPLPR